MDKQTLELYVSREDYDFMRGNNWPVYEDYLNGVKADEPTIQEHVDKFTQNQVSYGIRFPIRTATSCQYKWTWSTIYLNSLSTASCHRTQIWPIDINNFDNFNNVPEKIIAREKMLAGEWPGHGCEYCRDIEAAGGISDRIHNRDTRNLTPPELINDRTATHVTPRIVEIFAQNTCNLSCIYCNPVLSSKIQQENAKFGEFNQHGVHIPLHQAPDATREVFDKFISWVNRNIQTLARLHLLGGETFIQHDLMNNILDIIERNPSPDLTLGIFSNMNSPEKYWTLYMNRIKDLCQRGHLKELVLTASIDCWGPEQSYVRSGLDLELFEQRFAWASEQGSWLGLNANQTITAMTMKTMPDLIRVLARYGKNKIIGHWFQFYTGPQMFQHPQIFAYNEWADTFNEIFAIMPTENDEQRDAIIRMQGIQKLLQQSTVNNWTEIRKLQIYLDELDRRRGTNWRSLFPFIDAHE